LPNRSAIDRRGIMAQAPQGLPLIAYNRRVSNGDQVSRVAGLAMQSKPSVDFSGYWQRHTTAA
jgi:hypothetical protein